MQGAVFPAKAPEGIGEAAQDGDEGGVAGAVGESGQSSDEDGGGVRLPNRMQPRTVCGVTESKIELSRRLRGMKEAKEREMVRQAARRGVAFGFKSEGKIRRTEAVQSGRVVESSFAKGDWGVRWRE